MAGHRGYACPLVIRSFIALSPPPPVRDALAALQDQAPGGRAVDYENLHLTLAFLDAQPAALVQDIALALAEATPPAAFDVRIRGLDIFGSRTPRALVAAVDPSPGLTALHDHVRRRVRAGGLSLPHRRFKPHLTLMRFNGPVHPEAKAALAAFAARPVSGFGFRPRDYTLFRSTLSADGPRYDALAAFALGAASSDRAR